MKEKAKLFIAIITSLSIIILGILLLVMPEAFPFTKKNSQIYAFILLGYAIYRIYRIVKNLRSQKSK